MSQAADQAVNNVRAILSMLLSMALFIFNDALIKLVSDRLPIGQIICLRGLLSFAMVLIAAWSLGLLAHPRALATRPMAWRTIGEVGATLLYLTALFQMPLANATAILQIVPLACTAGSALFLGEAVGWRRWSAAIVGLLGALVIIRPGMEGFDAASLFAVASMGFIVLRDLITRKIDRAVSGLMITVMTSGAMTLTGAALSPFETWVWPSNTEFALLAAAAMFLTGGYLTIVYAMRTGEISVVSPFRYAIILWALLIGYLVWGDIPDMATIAGIVIVVGAGVYTFRREAALKIRRKSYVRT